MSQSELQSYYIEGEHIGARSYDQALRTSAAIQRQKEQDRKQKLLQDARSARTQPYYRGT